MIRHCVILTFSPGTTTEQIAAVEAGLGALPAAIDAIRSYSFGRDLGAAEGNGSFIVVAEFDSFDGYVAYRDHPVHQQVVVERIRPILASRAAVQYQI